MRLEVLISGEELRFFPINKSRIVLGTDEDCDIIISHPEISRHHLTIISEGENFFVTDRGSTNGSYLNEERLVPGRRVEFNSFFPVRLGKDVLISLLSDDDSEVEEKINIPVPKQAVPHSSEATRVISLKDLRSTNTSALVKKRTEIKKEAEKKKSQKPMGKKKRGFSLKPVHVAVVFVLSVGGYLNHSVKPKKAEAAKTENFIAANEDGTVNIPKTNHKVAYDLSKEWEMMMAHKNDIKCPDDELSVMLCRAIGIHSAPSEKWGVVPFQKNNLFYIHGSSLLDRARDILTPKKKSLTGDETPLILVDISDEDIARVAFALFIYDNFRAELPYDQLKDTNFLIGIYGKKEVDLRPQVIVKINAIGVQNLKQLITHTRISALSENGIKVINFLDQYMQFQILQEQNDE